MGVNARFLNHINFDLTYYRSHTYNQTFYASLPQGAGYSRVPVQSGDVMNQGIEMALGYNNEWGDFRFSTNYTLTWNENKVVELVDNVMNPFTGEPVDMSTVNLDMGSFGGLDSKIILKKDGSMGDVYAQHLLMRDFNGYIYDDPSAGLTMETKGDLPGLDLPEGQHGMEHALRLEGPRPGHDLRRPYGRYRHERHGVLPRPVRRVGAFGQPA